MLFVTSMRMWSDLSNEEDAEELQLDDSPEVFQAFVIFVYADKWHPLDGEKLPQLLRFADKYEAMELRWRCTEVLMQKVCGVPDLSVASASSS